MRARAVDAALAALATMIAAWPLSTLLEQPTWVRSCLVLVAVVALSGVGARLLALRGWQVAAAQLVAVVLDRGRPLRAGSPVARAAHRRHRSRRPAPC